MLKGGLPDFVIDDDRRWTYVLLHGDDHESGWDTTWISDGQARLLSRLLREHYPDSLGLDLLRLLERRLNAPRAPKGRHIRARGNAPGRGRTGEVEP